MGMATLPLFNDLREASSNWDFKAVLLVDDHRERHQLERGDQLRSIEIEQVGRMPACSGGFVTLLCLK